MPYKDKFKDREWHRDYMRQKRHGVTSGVTKPEATGVTHTAKMGFEPKPTGRADADGNLLPEGDL